MHQTTAVQIKLLTLLDFTAFSRFLKLRKCKCPSPSIELSKFNQPTILSHTFAENEHLNNKCEQDSNSLKHKAQEEQNGAVKASTSLEQLVTGW
jgi:hypothetical protein